MTYIAKPPRLVTGAAQKNVHTGALNNSRNNRNPSYIQATEDNLRREVETHIARCRQRRWAESRPHGQPVAIGDRHGKLQSWRADDGRARIFEVERS